MIIRTEEVYYKPIRTGNIFCNNYIEYDSNGDRGKTSIKEYLYEIKSYLNGLIDDPKTQCEWKNQLTIAINFISSKDSDETCITHTISDNIEIMKGNETAEIIE